MYILISFHIVYKYHAKTDVFFPPKSNMITHVILILWSSSKKNLIITHLRFRHNIECFCSISTTNIISMCVSEQQLFCPSKCLCTSLLTLNNLVLKVGLQVHFKNSLRTADCIDGRLTHSSPHVVTNLY